MKRILICMLLVCSPVILYCQADEDQALQRSVKKLQLAIGKWDVVTEFLNEDGSVEKSVKGTYEFSWVVQDRVVAGRAAFRK